MANTKYLVRKGVILQGGIKEANNSNIIVPFDNMSIGGVKDPSNVVLASTEQVANMIALSKNSAFNIKYQSLVTDATYYPDMELLNYGYNTFGLPVVRVSDNVELRLIRNPSQPNEISVNDLDGIIYVVEANGKFEIAGFNAALNYIDQQGNSFPGSWLIDTTKNDYDITIAGIKNSIAGAQADIANLESGKANTTSTDFIRTDGTTVMTGSYTSLNRPFAAVVRQELDSDILPLQTANTTNTAAIALKQNITDNALSTTAKTIVPAINEIKTIADVATTNINTNTIELTGHETRLAALEVTGANNYATGFVEYFSQIGTSPIAGGSASKQQFNLKSLTNPDVGSAHSADFTFTAEQEFDIIVRIGTTSANYVNREIRLSCGAPEATIYDTVTVGAIGTVVSLRAKLGTDGILVVDTTTTGTAFPGFDLTNAVLTEVSQVIISPITAIVNQTDLAKKQDTIINIAGITAKTVPLALTELNTKITTKVNTTDFNTFKTANTTAINAKQNATDAALTTTSKNIVGAINEKINTATANATYANLSLANINGGVQTEEKLVGFGTDGKLIKKSVNQLMSTIVQPVIKNHVILTPANNASWVPAGETAASIYPRLLSISIRFTVSGERYYNSFILDGVNGTWSINPKVGAVESSVLLLKSGLLSFGTVNPAAIFDRLTFTYIDGTVGSLPTPDDDVMDDTTLIALEGMVLN